MQRRGGLIQSRAALCSSLQLGGPLSSSATAKSSQLVNTCTVSGTHLFLVNPSSVRNQSICGRNTPTARLILYGTFHAAESKSDCFAFSVTRRAVAHTYPLCVPRTGSAVLDFCRLAAQPLEIVKMQHAKLVFKKTYGFHVRFLTSRPHLHVLPCRIVGMWCCQGNFIKCT